MLKINKIVIFKDIAMFQIFLMLLLSYIFTCRGCDEVIVYKNQSGNISCNSGIIEIISANFWERKISFNTFNDTVNVTDCYGNETLILIENLCNGKVSCGIEENKDIFPDGCNETYRYLNLSFCCSDSSSEHGITTTAKSITYNDKGLSSGLWALIGIIIALVVFIPSSAVSVILWRRFKTKNASSNFKDDVRTNTEIYEINDLEYDYACKDNMQRKEVKQQEREIKSETGCEFKSQPENTDALYLNAAQEICKTKDNKTNSFRNSDNEHIYSNSEFDEPLYSNCNTHYEELETDKNRIENQTQEFYTDMNKENGDDIYAN